MYWHVVVNLIVSRMLTKNAGLWILFEPDDCIVFEISTSYLIKVHVNTDSIIKDTECTSLVLYI